jgi:hypothetical protein
MARLMDVAELHELTASDSADAITGDAQSSPKARGIGDASARSRTELMRASESEGHDEI